ncbi:MAG: N-formylglutamate amidohydrolase [Hyphomicrobiaceae bacterium]
MGGNAACGVVVLCDHATNHCPSEYGTLGLNPAELERHIAYDIGAQAVTRGLAARLGAPAVLSSFSRLLIDPNRGDDDPTLIMRIADGAVIAGNRHLDAAERSRRINRFYAPYHSAIARVLDACLDTGTVPIIISMHSFTPVWNGIPRPWHAGILWDTDPRLALPFLDALRADPALVVGDNEPYTGILKGDTMWKHATQRGLAAALVEVRQDLIATAQGQDSWSERLACIVDSILAAPAHSASLRRVEHYGSHSDTQPINPITQGLS